MIRLLMFLAGLGMFLLGVASNYPRIPSPGDFASKELQIIAVTVTADVVLMVAGLFLMVTTWIFHKLASGNM